MKSRSADAVFDYHDSECGTKIREYTNNSLNYVLDTISTEASYNICAEAFPSTSSEPMNLVSLLPLSTWPRKDVQTLVILAHITFGEAFSKFGTDLLPIKEHLDFGAMF